MSRMLEFIDYKKIFYYFEEISNIPRGSGNNQQISDYLVDFAVKHELEYYQDKFLNVIIIKEASNGYEHVPPVILQGHMDMVCEKNDGSGHDFTKQGLDLKIDGDFISADQTTLGGDDGIAIAYGLALLDDDTLKHPRIELVITTDEEVGMDGAIGLNTDVLQSRCMINIDSEEEGVLLSSSAGGMTSVCTIPVQRTKTEGVMTEIRIKGLQGGHSGTEINKNRTNANMLLGRILFLLKQEVPFWLVTINGGQKDNAIPREASAVILTKQEPPSLLKSIAEECIKELKVSEPALSVTQNQADVPEMPMTEKDTDKILRFLLHTPNGVQTMSASIENLVESSLNLGILKTEEDKVIFSYSVRSSKNTYREFLSRRLQDLTNIFHGIYQVKGMYPAWEYNENSRLRTLMVQVYEEMYGERPAVEAIHAGLECGIISDKIPGLDIISMGPDIFDIHTPAERLSISSAKRVYDYLMRILEEMKSFK